ALCLVSFTRRDPAQTWSLDVSRQKLDEALRSPVQIRSGLAELPQQGDITLQTIIQDWEGASQTQALQRKLRELELLRLRVAPEIIALVSGYYQVLTEFLRTRDQTGSFLPFVKRTSRNRVVEQTLKQLNALDAERAALRAQDNAEQAFQLNPKISLAP